MCIYIYTPKKERKMQSFSFLHLSTTRNPTHLLCEPNVPWARAILNDGGGGMMKEWTGFPSRPESMRIGVCSVNPKKQGRIA